MGSSPLQEMRAAERQHLESQLRAVQDREARLQNSIISAQNGGTGLTMSPNQQLGGLLVPKVGRYLPTTLLVGCFEPMKWLEDAPISCVISMSCTVNGR